MNEKYRTTPEEIVQAEDNMSSEKRLDSIEREQTIERADEVAQEIEKIALELEAKLTDPLNQSVMEEYKDCLEKMAKDARVFGKNGFDVELDGASTNTYLRLFVGRTGSKKTMLASKLYFSSGGSLADRMFDSRELRQSIERNDYENTTRFISILETARLFEESSFKDDSK